MGLQRTLIEGFLTLLIVFAAAANARKFDSNTNPNSDIVNFIEDPKSLSTIDFSQATPGPDGVVCVERMKTVDKTEKDQLKECFVQNVTQCYYTYVTEYSDAEQEKCEDFYWKQCKIVFKQKTYNATSRQCKRPLRKECDENPQPFDSNNPGANANNDNIVCETFFETECNTTDVLPEPGDEPLAVTFCDKIPRKICAPDNCKVVEGPEDCSEEVSEQIVDYPVELCDLQPQKHCSVVKVAVPRLTPEKRCRDIEKNICNTQLVNPHDLQKTVFIKYCTRQEMLEENNRNSQPVQASYLPPTSSGQPSSQSAPPSYLPPPPPPRNVQQSAPSQGINSRFPSSSSGPLFNSNSPPTSSFGSASQNFQPVYTSPAGNALRTKKEVNVISATKVSPNPVSLNWQQRQQQQQLLQINNQWPNAQRRNGDATTPSVVRQPPSSPSKITVSSVKQPKSIKIDNKKSSSNNLRSGRSVDFDRWSPVSK